MLIVIFNRFHNYRIFWKAMTLIVVTWKTHWFTRIINVQLSIHTAAVARILTRVSTKIFDCLATTNNIDYYLKFPALRFKFKAGTAINANLPLAAFAFWVRGKHGSFFVGALSKFFGINIAMLPLIVARATTRSRKRHWNPRYIHSDETIYKLKRIFTTLTRYLQIWWRNRSNESENARQNLLKQDGSTRMKFELSTIKTFVTE